MASDPKLKAEIGPDGLAREAPVIAYTEKVNQYSLSGCIVCVLLYNPTKCWCDFVFTERDLCCF